MSEEMVDVERAAFEDWADSQWPGAKREQLKCDDYGEYLNSIYRDLWRGWQARASLPAGVPAELHARCAEILDWQASGVLSGNALRNYAAGKPYADQHNALQIAESDTAREAFSLIAAAPAIQAEQPAAASAGVEEVEVVGHLATMEPAGLGGEIVARLVEPDDFHVVASPRLIKREPLMTVAQHTRIVAQLSAQTAADPWAASGVEYDREIHHNPDAKAWADMFVATFPGQADKHDLMLAWFANAMMAMHDWLKSQEAQRDGVVGVPRELLADLVSLDHDTRINAVRRLIALLSRNDGGGE